MARKALKLLVVLLMAGVLETAGLAYAAAGKGRDAPYDQ